MDEIEACKQSEQRFRAILNTFKEGYFEINLNGDFTYFSTSICDMSGYSADELMGKNFHEYTSEETAKRVFGIYHQIYITGEPAEVFCYEVIRKDGGMLYLEVSAYLMHDSDGHRIGFRGFCRDVTQRHKMETDLQESEERFRRLHEASFGGIGIHDKGKILECNKGLVDLTGFAYEELIGMDGLALITPECREKVMEKILADYEKPYEVEGIRKDGSGYPLEVQGKVIQYQGRRVRVTEFRDITERKQAEKDRKKLESQLHQAQKMESIGILAGGIAHDFNNLLMAIQGRLSLLMYEMKKTNASAPQIKKMKEIDEDLVRAADLTAKLLGFARKGKTEVKPTDINNLIEHQTMMFGRTKKEIIIHEELSKDLPAVEVDRSQIEQVLLNIYVNAAQAMPQGGNLYIRTENITLTDKETGPHDALPGVYVKISVTDTGIGMDKKIQPRIFEPFFTTKEIGRGTGLGLASAFGIIKNHHGFITVYSEKERGSTFNIFLPATQKTPVKETLPVEEIVMGGGTILLVDDEEVVIAVGSEMLITLGYKVLATRSGSEAIAVYQAQQKEIDLIILDMIMPGMGGDEMFDRFKQINPKVKILLASGYSIDGQATAIMSRGCDGFIQKPYSMTVLSRKIREILGVTEK
jgi:two-component system, cell cycle sensor histidine kinase and response regulator CckA